MFILITALKNLCRHKTRYILSGILLLCVLSVMSCALYYATHIPSYIKQQINLYVNIDLRFRDNLHWNGNKLAYWATMGFNSDGLMDKYNYPINVKREVFEQISEIEYVKETILAYTEIVYSIFNDNPTLLYGGSLDGFTWLAYSGHSCLVLSDGKLHERGECLINRLTAREFNLNIGDYITYTDEMGNERSLKISGFFQDFNEHRFGVSPDSEYRTFRIGSNPFFSNWYYIKYMVITDFDTVYYMYEEDEEKHEFNKYYVRYILHERKNIDAFIKETEKYNIDPTLGFHHNYYEYNYTVEVPYQLINMATVFAMIALGMSGIITLILTMYLLKERRYEMGILYSLGVTRLQMTLNYLYEIISYIFILTFISIFTGKILHRFTLVNVPFIEELNINYPIDILFLFNLFGFSLIIALASVIVILINILRASPVKLISYRGK